MWHSTHKNTYSCSQNAEFSVQVLHQVSTLLGLSIMPRSGKPISPTCIPLMDVKLLGRFIQIFLMYLHLWFVANYPKCYGRHEWSCLWIKSFLQRLMSCKACCIYEAIFRATFWRIYLDTLDSVLTRSRYFFVDVWGREREPQWRQCHAFQCNVALRNICYYVSRLWVE